MSDVNITMTILALIVGAIIGYVFADKKPKPEGTIRFFLAPLDEENEVVQLSVKPEKDWEEVMDQTMITFEIVKDPKIDTEKMKNE